MNKIISKFLIVIIGLMLGISKEVAAQYGIVNCHYLFKGKVESGLCEKGIEGIKVSITDPADSKFHAGTAVTASDGSYQLEIETPATPGELPELLLKVEDVDGTSNQGEFISQQSVIRLDKSNIFETGKAEWEVDYAILFENRFLLRKEDKLPCQDKK